VTSGDSIELPRPRGKDLRHPLLWLLAVTALAAALRFHGLGSDLWLDEITTVLDYRNVSPLRVVTEYTSSNNHLSNTLLVKAMVSLFGPSEWAIRLPAALFGIACIPACYALARIALGQGDSLFAAFLLSVSYHHIFFSQNGRGYTALLFWSMLGTVFFLRGLARGHPRDAILYVAAMFLAIATVLYGFFVVAGHALAFAVFCAMLLRRRAHPWPLARRMIPAWAALALLSLVLYASAFRQIRAYADTVYRTAAVGYAPLSGEFLRELWRGLSAGLGGAAIAGALVGVPIIGWGLVLFVRRHAFYALTLVSPLVATAAFLLARGLRFSPRFFLWALPVAWIFAAAALACLGQSLVDHWPRTTRKAGGAVSVAGVAILAAFSVLTLPAYYRTPKQPNRASLDWVLAQRREGDSIAAAYLARWGLRFYGPERGLTEGRSFFAVLSAEELRRVENESSGHTVWLLTTFPRALRLEYADLDRYIRENYREQKTFAATIGDGEVTVWSRKIP
jgi:mannosyltransferase